MKSTVITFRPKNEHNAWLRRAAKKSKRSITSLIEELINNAFENRHAK